MSTALIALPTKETALQVFTTDKGLDPYLKLVREQIDEFSADVTTKKGREEIASFAHKVAKVKTAIDAIGKEENVAQKLIPAKIDAERKRAWDILEGWQKEVRLPLTEYETKEANRIQTLQNRVEALFITQTEFKHSDEIQALIDQLNAVVIDETFEEFKLDAEQTRDRSLSKLNALFTAKKQYEADQAELARLRAEAEERAKVEREERIAREASESARIAAEKAAEDEKQRLIAEAAHQEAETKRLQDEAIKAQEAAAQALRDAELKAEADKQQAIADERKRVADELEQERIAQEKREANLRHRKKINNEAVDDLLKLGITKELAMEIITAIAKKEVRNVSIAY